MSRPEEALHRAVARLLALYEARGLLKFCHVPNGGYRRKAEAGVFRALGVKTGVPDLLVWLPGGRHVQIELKAAGGKLSDRQAEWIVGIHKFGVTVHVCRSLDEVMAVLEREGVPRLAQVQGAA